jgi:hypothetical protein
MTVSLAAMIAPLSLAVNPELGGNVLRSLAQLHAGFL